MSTSTKVQVKSDPLSARDVLVIGAAGVAGFVSVAAVALLGFWAVYRLEVRSMRRNREVTR